MNNIKEYHLKNYNRYNKDISVHNLGSYYQKYKDKSTLPHRHSYFQIIWFDSPGRHFVDFKTFEHSSNSIYLINKNQIHYFCADSENEGILIHFNEEFLALNEKSYDGLFYFQLFNDFNSSYQNLTTQQVHSLIGLRNQIKQEFANPSSLSSRAIYLNLQLFLIHIFRYKQLSGEIARTPLRENWIDFLTFRKYIDQHIDELLTVEYIADQLNIDKKKLANLTKQLVGKSPGEIMAERKILEAKRLLSNTRNTIKEVSYSLGFDQATYFTKYFKKHTQLTPKAFIASLK